VDTADKRTVPGEGEKRIAGQPNSYQEMMAMYGHQAASIREQENYVEKGAAKPSKAKGLHEEKMNEHEAIVPDSNALKTRWPSQAAKEEASKKGGN